MVRNVLASVLLGGALVAGLHAQTATANPQHPAKSVESVRPLKSVKEDAARLDAVLDRGLQRRSQTALPLTDDATFLRRAYLTIVGRIPTLAETETFLADQNPDKRDVLCDQLLDSPGHTSHFANFWFDQLRVKSRIQDISGEPFADYLRSSIQQDKPYDQLVHEMLVATGPGHQQGNGATGMLLRDKNMPHDAMANALRLFLGTRLECAQCHNHPFDIWTQKQFFEMAAFFGGLRYRDESTLPNLVGLRTELAGLDDRTRQRALNLVRRNNQGLEGSGSGVERLPRDYKYEDLKPGTAVLANTLFGADVKLKYPEQKKGEPQRPRRDQRPQPGAAGIDSRGALADWMTSKKNPQFAKVIANRMWARTFGAGVVEPLDDFKKDTEPVHPELMVQIEKLMVDLDFDLRQFERVLVHTKLFQRESPAGDADADAVFTFQGPMLRRMTAEQTWDSLLTLVFADIDERLRPPDARAQQVYQQFAEFANADAKDLIALAQNDQPMRAQQQQQRQREEMRQQVAADAELEKKAAPLRRQLNQARRNGDQKQVAAIAEELQRLGVPLGQRAARGREGDLLRASDLQQPAPPNHLLRQFGQSTRETVDGASTVATVPQVMTLLNGFLDQRVLEGQSALRASLDTAQNGERRVRIAFLRR